MAVPAPHAVSVVLLGLLGMGLRRALRLSTS
jgi:hypothetical protein